MSFRFRPEKPLLWQAGQYLRYELTINGTPQDHWFTIASAPFEGEVMVTTHIRPSSPYKQALAALQPGDTIKASGLGGDFVWREDVRSLVFIAAGIGVTPFYSMLRQRAHAGQPLTATLLYNNLSKNI